MKTNYQTWQKKMGNLVVGRGLYCQWFTLTGSKDINRTPSECEQIACAGDLTAIIPCVLFSGNVSMRGTWGVLNTATPQKKLTNTAPPQEKSAKHRHRNSYFWRHDSFIYT